MDSTFQDVLSDPILTEKDQYQNFNFKSERFLYQQGLKIGNYQLKDNNLVEMLGALALL